TDWTCRLDRARATTKADAHGGFADVQGYGDHSGAPPRPHNGLHALPRPCATGKESARSRWSAHVRELRDHSGPPWRRRNGLRAPRRPRAPDNVSGRTPFADVGELRDRLAEATWRTGRAASTVPERQRRRTHAMVRSRARATRLFGPVAESAKRNAFAA